MLHDAVPPKRSQVRELVDRFIPSVPRRASEAESIVRELFAHADIQFGGTRAWDITVHDSRFYERVLRDASVGFGEAYMGTGGRRRTSIR
jgi:hypothetical protein